MAVVFMMFTFTPQNVMALGTGPNQPELESFAPVGMDNMVDLFTGDFNYNLPLLTVPGPNGGYPINMTYNAGVGMEQEASWVGLGWNLNPGVVNRELRGLPDDFNGVEVKKVLSQRPNRTFTAKIGVTTAELFGADLSKIKFNGKGLAANANLNLSYNNYKGFDVGLGLGFAFENVKQSGGVNEAKKSPPIDTATGEKLTLLSYLEKIEMDKSKSLISRGMAHYGHQFGSNIKNFPMRVMHDPAGALGRASVIDISDIGYSHPMTSGSYSLNVKTGLSVFGFDADLRFDVGYSYQKISDSDKEQNIPAFGYLFSEQNLDRSEQGLMDFSLMNQSMITPDSKTLPIPNSTYDVFHVKTQGVSGTARPFKGSFEVLTDPFTKSNATTIGGGFELNQLVTSKIGANFNFGTTKSYNGPWKGGTQSINSLMSQMASKQDQSPLYEPYYFQFTDELTSEVNEQSVFQNTSAQAFGISSQMGAVAHEAKLSATLKGAPSTDLKASNAFREERVPRAKHFLALTELEAKNYDGSGFSREVYNLGTSSPETVSYATSGAEAEQLGAVHILDAGGTRYHFGIPAKNKVHKSVVFSTDQHTLGTSVGNLTTKAKMFGNGENTKDNDAGQNHHYSATELPPYAHSFLLTEILSEDFVDISEDGPTVDDFGDYVRFDYQMVKNFKTRSTPNGGALIPGQLSNTGDDKMSYTYFEKDIYYVRTIETKTHVAVFTVEPRQDAKGVASEHSAALGASQYLLRKIDLYNLSEYKASPGMAKPIKTVNFDYSYDLCTSTPSSAEASKGKLTLTGIYFTVGDQRTKTSLSPYEFEYAATANKAYNQDNTDRWGSYQEEADNPFGSNNLYPYTTKNVAKADENAQVWNLSKITLPTGGTIEVDYEADRYQYVQNKKAQSMFRIRGFTNTINGTFSSSLNDNNNFVVVELDKTINASEAKKYVEGLSDLYFKAFVRMKRFPAASNTEPGSSTPLSDGTDAFDFVEGYFKYADTVSLYPNGSGSSNMLILRVSKAGGNQAVKKAGWVELQASRSDLIDESKFTLDGFSNLALGILGEIGNIVSRALEFLIRDNSFFIRAAALGYCNEISESGDMRSIIRLNAGGDKLGGGHRVKSISISDQWDQMSVDGSVKTYGQDYFYELEDGSSSGVAQYEPMTGGEENPFRKPIRYSTQKITFKNDYLYTEEPLGEDFFPSASVGYSRVVVVNKANEVVTISGEGIKVNEFYTAKDYPTQVERTALQKVNTDFKTKFLQFIGLKNFFQPGFSQGFSIELNNMHGKQKSEATYSAYADIEKDVAVSKTEYFYKTHNGYAPNKANKLLSKVSAYESDGVQEEKEVGKTVDVFGYLKESSSRSINGAIDGNLDFGFAVFFVPTAWPSLDYAYTMTRFASVNKVVNRIGILDRVTNQTNGATITTEHLAFDGQTGEPIVSAITNEFKDTYYTYKQKAKWYYDEMGAAYQNLGLQTDNIDAYASIIANGDLFVNASGDKAWAQVDVNGNLSFRKKNGTVVSKTALADYRLIESGYGNNLSTDVATIQSKNFGKPTNGVLNTSGQTFSDLLKLKADIAVINASDTVGLKLNPQAYRYSGVYKPETSYFYKQARNQSHTGGFSFHTNIRQDGTYQSFNAFDPFNLSSDWNVASTVTGYDFNGMPIEEQNALGNYSAVLYGYNRALPIAVAQNCAYDELAFNGFEDYDVPGLVNGKSAHLVLNDANITRTTAPDEVHSGNYGVSLDVASESINLNANGLSLTSGKKYIVHLWVKANSGGNAKVNNGGVVNPVYLAKNIDGWNLLEIQFTAGGSNSLILEGNGGIFDDIKVQPFNASSKTYVYDERTHQLLAALDENHYATFYNYDRDMVLVQVKKETQRGIKTIQATMRSTSNIQEPAP
jgi:hypothetical protein